MNFRFIPLAVMLLISLQISSQSIDKEALKSRLSKPAALFEENKGQMKDQNWKPRPDVLYYGNQEGMNYYIKNNGVSYQLSRVDSWKEEESKPSMPEVDIRKVPDQITSYRVDAHWLGLNTDFKIEKGNTIDGYNNYYNVPEGVEPALFVKQYESVTLKNVWNGIDIHYYGTDGLLETDYNVTPGADYRQIRMEINGAELSISDEGHLIIKTPLGEIREGELKVYQGEDRLKAYWKIGDGNKVSFEIPEYNPAIALRIDPVARVWATYYGGGGDERGNGTTTDAAGNVYLAGGTSSTTSIASGGHQNTFGGFNDAFLVKFSSSGVRQWGTYYGGNSNDVGYGTATDADGNVYLAGTTISSTSIASGGHQNTLAGADAFLVKFSSSGIRQWGTYYGGIGGSSRVLGVTTDAAGNVYLAGSTSSTTSITSGGHQNTFGGGTYDAFLVKFNSSGVRQWGTYYGGSGDDYGYGTDTDAAGNVYLAGFTNSATSIASVGHQNTFGGIYDAFLVKFSSSGVRQWGTYYGGSGSEDGEGTTTDASGNVYLTGYTQSPNSIASGGHQNTFGGGNYDAFLVKFNSSGVRQWGTYYGGSGGDFGNGLTTDAIGNVYMAGSTSSYTSIASGGHQNTFGGNDDAFLVKFSSSGVRQWGTYYGGNSNDFGEGTIIDAAGNIYLAGRASSTTSIASSGHQNTYGGGNEDKFLVKFNETLFITNQPPQTISICSNTLVSMGINTVGAGLTYQWKVKSPTAVQFSNITIGGVNAFSGFNTSTLSIGTPTIGLSGYSFQCLVSDGTVSETSSTSILTVYSVPTITSQPISVASCANSTANFAMSATGTGLTYQWQFLTTTTTVWSNCVDGSVYSGSTTSTLQVTTSTALNNYQYRCIVTNSNACSTTSNTSILNVYSVPTITSQPISVASCANSTANFAVSLTVTGLTYQWQFLTTTTTVWSNCINGSVYSGTTTNSLQVFSTANLNNYQYRCIVTSGNICSTISNTSILNVFSVPAITSQPVSAALCANSTTNFAVSATGTSLTYQWQFLTTTTTVWSNCVDGSVYSGSTTSTLQVATSTALNNYQYRCILTSGNICSTISNTSFLTVYLATNITSQPTSLTICPSQVAIFSLSATGTSLSYQWQYRSSSLVAWANCTNGPIYSGVTTNNLQVINPNSFNNYEYKCIVTNVSCFSNLSSNICSLTVSPTIYIQPSSSTVCTNQTINITLNATGIGLTYQWQNRASSTSLWTNCINGAIYGGVTTNTLQILNSVSLNNYEYKCLVTASNGCTSFSNTINLTVATSPLLTNLPSTFTTCQNQATSLNLSASGLGLTYQWQSRPNSTAPWTNCSNGPIYSGSTTNLLEMVPFTLNNHEFRCIVTNSNLCSSTSNTSVLTVFQDPVIASQPISVTTCANQATNFTVSVTGSGITYQWQNRSNSTAPWTNCINGPIYSGSTANSLLVLNPSSLNSNEFRCVVTNGNGCTTTTNFAILTINTIPIFSSQPIAVSVCPTQTANFTVSASGTGLFYQWQNRNGASGTWANCTNGSIYSGSSSNSLQVLNVSGLNNYQYRCVTTISNGCSATSNAVNLTVYSNLTAVITADGVFANPVNINLGDANALVLTGSFNSSNPNIVWSPSSGLSATNTASPIAYPSTNTLYTATFTNIYGCTQSTSIQMNVNPLPLNGSISVISGSGLSSFNILDTLKVEIRLNGASDIYAAFARLRYFGPLASYLNYVGYTAGTILGTGAAVISTPPIASGTYGYDFGLTKIGAVPGYTGTGTLYTFFFKPNSIPSTLLGSQVCFYVDNLTVNNASQGSLVGLVNQGVSCFTFNNQANVWPGDLDNNKTVNTADLLKIGVFYNNTGPTRPNSSLQWIAQPTTLWGLNASTPNSDAFKAFADGNGDGIINNADQTSVGFNMGKIHAFVNPLDSLLNGNDFERISFTGNIDITSSPAYLNTNQLPSQIELQVSLNNAGGTLNNLYGISFDISLDSNVFDLQNPSYDYGGSIFGLPNQDFLKIEYVSNGVLSVGMTRFNNPTINGNGLLCKIRLNTNTGVNYPDTNLVFNGTVMAANDSIGVPYAISPTTLTMPYGTTASLSSANQNLQQVILYPNPAFNILNLGFNNSLFIKEIKVFDASGRLVIQQNPNAKLNSYSINTEILSPGIYAVEISTQNGSINKKLVKVQD
jgi:hypothetical protein